MILESKHHQVTYSCTVNDTLADVCQAAFMRQFGHRVVVIDENRKVVDMISQTDIVKFLAEYVGFIPHADKKLIDLNCASRSTLYYLPSF